MKEQRNLKQTLFLAPLISDVLNDNELRLPERAILSLLLQLSIKNGYCFANNKYFANIFNCSLSTVSKSIKKLHQLGYIIKNVPDPDRGGRRYRRYLKPELFYKPVSSNNKSSIVNDTNLNSKKTNHSIKRNNEIENIYLSEQEERDLVQQKIKSNFRKWTFYCSCKKAYNETYCIEWNKNSITYLIDLCNRMSVHYETKVMKIVSATDIRFLKVFKLFLSCKPKFFSDALPRTFFTYFEKVTSQPDFLRTYTIVGDKVKENSFI